MEQFGALKRRTTDLMTQAQGQMSNLQKPNMPNMPSMPSMPSNLPNFPTLTDLSSKLPKMPTFGMVHPHKTGNPTQKATWERIDVPPLPRSSHSINVVSGNAYIFGGEVQPREPVDNDMHIITLPFSSAGADYYAVKAKAAPKPEVPAVPTVIEPSDDGKGDDAEAEKELADVSLSSPNEQGEEVVTGSENISDGPDSGPSTAKQPARAEAADVSSLGDVPCPRVGHATAVIGNRIFLFGGRGGPDLTPLEEYGRVWVFDTKTHLWSYLDPLLPAAEPLSPAFADKRHHYPAARSYHSAAGVDQPRDFETRRKVETWAEWAQGDSNVRGTPQRPIVGNVASNSRDEDDDGYGTFIIHSGCFAEGGRANDTWAFDIRSRLDCLDLVVDDFSEATGERDVVLSARGGWKSIFPDQLPGSPAAPLVAAAEGAPPVAEATTGEEDAAVPLKAEAAEPNWPGNRSVAGMQTVTMGGPGGREYLVLLLGERDPSEAGHEAAGKFWDDIWAYELPRPTMASSALGAVFGRARSGSRTLDRPAEGKWFRVETEAYDDDDEAAAEGPGPRGWFAAGHMGELEERGVLIWGGVDGTNKRLGDGWILRLGSEKREP
ncbi:Leucine-zipper-like transcriptional regulator 1 [Cytospora mali]|uniref:Leucine-zipper-like transcriptional regulator 1 n=1 Tax=Cytospora mali TaxID=578113 RepID=A0A194VAJ8_CYTMA|nr:Leucine-zipper-like transcriptional regulator 1 [Valsa mali var. pyri (nom. inval.)]